MANQVNLSPEAQRAIEEYLAERSRKRAETIERAGYSVPVPPEPPPAPPAGEDLRAKNDSSS
ncbi:MAG TPA: hypothetical protein VF789_22615 [Thermoanaerobaculia bacterium]